MWSSLVTVWLVGFTLISLDTSARAGSLSDLLESPLFRRLELAQIAPALATTVASSYPVASASSSVTYVYNPTLETFERETRVAGPIIGERAETIGKGAFNFAASYSYVHLTTINGDDLDQLVNRVTVGGRLIVFPVKGGTTLKDGRFTNSRGAPHHGDDPRDAASLRRRRALTRGRASGSRRGGGVSALPPSAHDRACPSSRP